MDEMFIHFLFLKIGTRVFGPCYQFRLFRLNMGRACGGHLNCTIKGKVMEQ